MKAAQKQSSLIAPFIAEIDEEAEITKRLLEIIPEDKLTWRPHPKAMSLGQLALHIAQSQGAVAEVAQADTVGLPGFTQAEAATCAEILDAFVESTQEAKDILSATSDEQALAEWKLVDGERVLMAMPRTAVWRSIMLNHNYHHRGQLSTYLRTLDIPLPSIYGTSADTNPFI